jgi:type IV secretion system protein TrbL
MGFCDWVRDHHGINPLCDIKDAAKGGVAELGSSAFDKIVSEFASAAASTVKELTTGWLKIDTPSLKQDSGPIYFLRDSIAWITSWIAVLCLLIVAGKMMWDRKGQPARDAAAGILRLVLVSAAGVAAVNLLAKAGDSFSVWIVNRSTKCGGADKATGKCVDAFGDRILTMTILAGKPGNTGLVLIMALLLILASIIQIAFMLCRNAMIIVLAGTLPLSAAASTTEAGKAWFNKSLGWLLAFVLYKPAAAIIYAAAFASIGRSSESDFYTQVSGVMLLILAALTLPAMMKFVTPMVAAVTMGGSGAGAIVAGAGSAVATGAIAVKTGGASTAAKGAAGSKGAGGAGPAAPGTKPGPVPAQGGGPRGGSANGTGPGGIPNGAAPQQGPPSSDRAPSGGPSPGSAGESPPPPGGSRHSGPATMPPAPNRRREEGPDGSR